MHRIASGQDFAQSGKAGFSSGQHGMPSGIETVSDMPTIDASSIATALDGVTIGAVKRPTIARIESKRGMSDKSCTRIGCHRERGERRAGPHIFRLAKLTCHGRGESYTCDPLRLWSSFEATELR